MDKNELKKAMETKAKMIASAKSELLKRDPNADVSMLTQLQNLLTRKMPLEMKQKAIQELHDKAQKLCQQT